MISDYAKFQAKLYPVLPFLIFKAYLVKRNSPSLPAITENLTLGMGNRKILILGESTAAGVGASNPKSSLAGHLSFQLGGAFQVFNFGKNGLLVNQAISHFGDILNSFTGNFEGVFLFLGANDYFQLTHPKNYSADLKTLLQSIKSTFNPKWIYLSDIPPVQLFPAFPNLLRGYLMQQRKFLQNEMKKIALEFDLLLFDPITIDITSDFFSSDKIHPSDHGYQKIAEFAIEGLVKMAGLKLE
jgi:lysophospholipase L1-like esterase